MWTTLALSLALLPAPAQKGGALIVTNPRLTYGYMGPERKDNTYLPGDVFAMTFEVRNMTFDEAGQAQYSVGMEVLDGKGEVRFRQLPRNLTAQNFLGGNSLFSVAYIDIPPKAKAGEFTIRMTVEDRAAKTKALLEHKTKVRPTDFGLIRVGTSADREGLVPCSPIGQLGESLYVNFSVVGFDRDKDKGQPQVDLAMRILDDRGKPTIARPLTSKIEGDLPERLPAAPMQFGLTLNRTGRFTVELTATDKISGKNARVTFPIQVVAPR